MIHYRFDERRGRFGIDCIAVTAQSSHSGGSAINQRECAGFNWPPLFVPAEQPVSISPKAVSRAGPSAVSRAIGLSATVALLPSGRLPVGEAPVAWREPSPSPRVGVGHPASTACLGSMSVRERVEPSGFVPVVAIPGLSFQSRALGVVQPHVRASQFRSAAPPLPFVRLPGPRIRTSCACGVVQPLSAPVQSLSDMRRAEARSAGIDRPAGVSRRFQVSLYKVEPTESVFACNLLAKDELRTALFDEVVEGGP